MEIPTSEHGEDISLAARAFQRPRRVSPAPAGVTIRIQGTASATARVALEPPMTCDSATDAVPQLNMRRPAGGRSPAVDGRRDVQVLIYVGAYATVMRKCRAARGTYG